MRINIRLKCTLASAILLLTSFKENNNTEFCFYSNQFGNIQKVDSTRLKSFEAKVIRIIDGDTLEVLYEMKPVKIRLLHIDCPEKRGKQPFGNAAKEALSNLCFGQIVKIEWNSKDRNGRYLSVVYNENNINVNQEMVRKGLAWHYKKFSTDKIYMQLENRAREQKIGLWKDPNPVPPWDWRRK